MVRAPGSSPKGRREPTVTSAEERVPVCLRTIGERDKNTTVTGAHLKGYASIGETTRICTWVRGLTEQSLGAEASTRSTARHGRETEVW